MRRSVTLDSKICRRQNQSLTEVMEPESIHEDARHQWMLSVCQMLSVFQASTGCRNFSSIHRNHQPRRIQHGQLARCDFLLRLLIISPREQFCDRNLPGDLRQTHHVVVCRSLLLRLRRQVIPFLVKSGEAVGQIQIDRSAIHVEKRILFDQQLLFRSPLVCRRLARRAGQWLL